MSEIFLGRQPIFDRLLEVAGYELLYRADPRNEARFEDADQATSQVLVHTFLEIGLDQVVGPQPAFINLTRSFLTGEIAIPLPPQRVVLEVLEGIAPDGALTAGLKALRAQGFRVALDDFVPGSAHEELLDLADIVKLDVQARGLDALRGDVQALSRRDLILVAEKVETQEEFEACRDMGFALFQGFFLSRPHVLQGSRMPASRMALFRLLTRLQDPRIQFAELQDIVAQDVSLSYRLLRLLNSAYYSMPTPVESLRQALVLLGIHRLRAWVSLFALGSVEGKPPELMILASVRAKMCELLAEKLELSHPDTYFTAGLLSCLDAVFDLPLSEVLKSIPLGPDIRGALLEHEGTLGRVLGCVQSYERAEWDAVSDFPWDADTLRQCYLEAVSWATTASTEMARS